MRKVLRIVLGIASVIAVPIFIDFFVFGNAFPSNIDNQAWAGFLGSYLGGIATLVAVFITISDNNKKIEIQRQSEKEQLAEQKKYAVRPYLDTRYMFFNEESKIGINDRVFDLKAGMVEKVRYNFTSTDKLYLLAPKEIYSNWSRDTAVDLTRQLDYYKKKGVTTNKNDWNGAIKKDSTGTNAWWLRSASSDSNSGFYIVRSIGGWNTNIAYGTNGVSPAFRIG